MTRFEEWSIILCHWDTRVHKRCHILHADIQFEIFVYLFSFLYCCLPPRPIDLNLCMHPKKRIRATRRLCLIVSRSWANVKDITLWNKVQIVWSGSKVFNTYSQSASSKIIGFYPNYSLFIQITHVSCSEWAMHWFIQSRWDCLDSLKAEVRRGCNKSKFTPRRPKEERADAL